MELTVGIGEIKIAKSPHLLKAVGIGSCVAVALYDEDAGIGGLAHIMLPCADEAHDRSNPARFADMAIDTMIEKMKSRGTRPRNIRASLFGGANMFPEIISSGTSMDIGKNNIMAAREKLAEHNIETITEEVGDHVGRSVVLDTRDGSISVKNTFEEEKLSGFKI